MTELLAMILIIFICGGTQRKNKMPKHWVTKKRTPAEDQAHKEEVLKFLKPY